MISVVVPSYLGHYKGAATNRVKKLHRAITSLLNQKTNIPFEIVFVSDGCDKSLDEISIYKDVSVYQIPKQPIWSGAVRNSGILKAQYPIIAYLDIDDFAGPEYIQTIADNFGNNDWIWFNDHIWNGENHVERECDIFKKYHCGTSNIAHRKLAWWVKGSYLHDWHFINELKLASNNFTKIQAPGYMVCHIDKEFDV